MGDVYDSLDLVMMYALVNPVTVAVVGRGYRETTMRSVGLLRSELASRSITETSTVVNVANNKCGELQH